MKLTIHQLLSLSSMKDATLLAGHAKSHNQIANIMVMEATDIERWMIPGQLLLTSLYGFQDFSVKHLTQFIEKVIAGQGCGIIVKSGRFVEKVPQLLVELCNDYQLPLIEISSDTQYNDIIVQVMQILFNDKVALLDYYYQTHQKFMQLALSNFEFETILSLLENTLNKPVLLLKGEQVLYSTKSTWEYTELRQPLPMATNTTYDFVRNLYYFSVYETCYPVVETPFFSDDLDQYVLKIIETDTIIEAFDFVAIENAINFIKMCIHKENTIRDVTRTFKNDLIDDIMLGRVDSAMYADQALANLKMDRNSFYRIIFVRFTQQHTHAPKKLYQLFIHFMKQHYPELTYRTRINRLIFIMPVSTKRRVKSITFKRQFNQLVEQFVAQQQQETHYQISISAPCKLPQFKEQSEQTYQNLELANTVLNNDSYCVINEDMMIYHFLQEFTQKHDPTLIVPQDLIQLYNTKYDLFVTLDTYLMQNKSIKQSAEALFVHPKTITYRLNSISKLTNINFEDAEVTLRYLLGIKILKVLPRQQLASTT